MGLKIVDPKISALINVDAENAFCGPDSLSTRPTRYSCHVGQAVTRLVPLLRGGREVGLRAISTIWGDAASRKSRLVGSFAEMAPDPISIVPIPVDVPFGEARLPEPLSSCKAERPVVARLAADRILTHLVLETPRQGHDAVPITDRLLDALSEPTAERRAAEHSLNAVDAEQIFQ